MSAATKGDCSLAIPRTISWDSAESAVRLIDQRLLPLRLEEMLCRTHGEMIDAIKTLALRGAPAIGVGGALALVAWALNESTETEVDAFVEAIQPVGEAVGAARPTAVNLTWAVKRCLAYVDELASRAGGNLDAVKSGLLEFVLGMCDEDEATNRSIGSHGASVLVPGSRIMTHCNAGSLATVFYGTALGVVFSAFDQGLVEHVYACETRPVNQGGRLTAWELMRAGIPSTLICDNMAATVMSKGMVDAVIVGADRIAANGDTANKIGTMGHAIIARRFGVDFYIAAPFSTIDASLASGSEIVIEQRNPDEVRGISVSGRFDQSDEATMRALAAAEDGVLDLAFDGPHRLQVAQDGDGMAFTGWFQNTPVGVDVFNPAFDVTPAELITGIITERGVFKPGELPC